MEEVNDNVDLNQQPIVESKESTSVVVDESSNILGARFREIAMSLLVQAKITEKGMIVMAIWRDEQHFQNWMNGIDKEANKKIRLNVTKGSEIGELREKYKIDDSTTLVILGTSKTENLEDFKAIYFMKAKSS